MAKTELEDRSKNFALAIIDLVERMPRTRAVDVWSSPDLMDREGVVSTERKADMPLARSLQAKKAVMQEP